MRGASGRGRGGRAQQERGGGGRPRRRQAAGRPRGCRRTGGSGGGSGDVPAAPSGSSSGTSKMAALPAQGFLSPSQWAGPQKKGGGGCARSWRSPEECGRGPACWPRPFLSPPLWTRRNAAEPAPLVLAPEGAEESAFAQAQSRVLAACGKLLRRLP